MTVFQKFAAAVTMLMVLPAFGSGERIFAPGPDLWDRWEAHDPASTAQIDHSAWDALLRAHVRPGVAGVAMVDYRGLADKQATLDAYLSDLAAVPISRFNRDEQFAYWINLYNALTVDLILEHRPEASIRDIDISPGLFGIGPWDKELIRVESEALTLNDIEHRILRPIWRDPRIHYGVNCASIGCPDLQPTAFTGANADQLLTEAARTYINHPRGVTVSGGKVTVSRIYDWFIEDFGGSESGVIAHLSQYAAPELKRQLAEIGDLSDSAYDWSLNAASAN